MVEPVFLLYTDFGSGSPYVGALHCEIIKKNPKARIIDVMHDIPSYDCIYTALMLQGLSSSLPPDSINLIVVDPYVGGERKVLLAMTKNNSYFLFPESEVLYFLKKNDFIEKIIEIDKSFFPSECFTFHGRDLFVPAAFLLLEVLNSGKDILSLGCSYKNPLPEIEEPYQVTENLWKAKIMGFDKFGNAISNFHRDLVGSNKNLSISFDLKREEKCCLYFSQVEKGKALVYFGSMGFLEIAINQDNAKDILELKKFDIIDIKIS